MANKPFFDALKKKYSYTQLDASGKSAGLIAGQPGNSEAGHLNLGAGRIVEDEAVIINKAIQDGSFFENPAFHSALKHQKKYQSDVHLMGLITETNSAHSHPSHWTAILNFLAREGVRKVYLHLFTDGRDSSPHGALKIIERFENSVHYDHQASNLKVEIASVVGRAYSMDRKKDWPTIEKAYKLLTEGEGYRAKNVQEAILGGYNRHETDEFISPTVITNNDKPVATIKDKDVVFFMNLRSDRARELTKAFVQTDFEQRNPGSFKREKIEHLFLVPLTDFGPDLDHTVPAFHGKIVDNSLPIWLDGIKQYYLAESEKYAHVTFFFNGGYDHAVMNEVRECIPSPFVPHYDLTPEMSAYKVKDCLIDKLKNMQPNFALVNFANPDMLGHTGNLEATKKGIEVVDQCLKEVVKVAFDEKKYIVVITADHGNADEMINPKTR
jgi:2,3-bisphosphoglycerate-independent phosphoglycerate mutase